MLGSIRSKLAGVLLLFASASLLFVWHAYHVSEQALERRIGQGLQRQASVLINQVDRMLFERYRNIQNWSANEVMIDVLTEDKTGRISEFLATMKREYGLYSELVYADNAGKIIAASHSKLVGKNVYGERWFQEVLAKQGIHSAGPERSSLTGGYVCTFAAPVQTELLLQKAKSLLEQGRESRSLLEILASWKPKSLGVLAAFMDWSEVMDLVNTMPVLEKDQQDVTAYAMLLDASGRVLTQPYFDSRAVMFHENLKAREFEAAVRATRGETGYLKEKGRYGEDDFSGYAPSRGYRDFKGFGWSILVFQRASEALAPIRILQVQIFGFGILLVLLLAGISFLLSRTLTNPLEKLAGLARAVAQGDFSHTVDIKSRDEIGALAGAFNEMIRDLGLAERELVHARDYVDNIIKSTVDALFVINKEGLIQKCNPAVTTLLGYEEAELLNQPIEMLIREEDVREKDIVIGVRRAGIFNAEMEYRAKDGHKIPMLVSAKTMQGSEGHAEGIVVIAKDVSEFRSLESQFQRAQKMDAVGRLAGGIAHDFNNMLTVINGYAEKMLRVLGQEDPRGGELGQILKAGKRAAGLVRQLLTFSRRQIIKPTVINFNELMLSMHKMLRHMLGENIEVVALPVENLWSVQLDPGQFEQVIANLAVNARDAMSAGGKFVMKTENMVVDESYASTRPGMRPGEYVLFSCQDTGSGMSEEVKKRIFEPFFTTKGPGKGTGLGLATCYGMVKQAGGYIEVESELGKGTVFKIYLPRVFGQVTSLEEVGGPEALPKGSETIFLVEDEILVRDLIVSVLKNQGYQILTASNGSEALYLMEEWPNQKIDLLLTDIVMPKMGGRELAERMSKIRPGIKILFMSGYIDDETIHSSVMEAAVAFLPKPITPSALAFKVREVLDGKMGEAAASSKVS